MADFRFVSATVAAVIFYAILQMSIVPDRQTRAVFPRSHESVDDHENHGTITERKVSNLRNAQTMSERNHKSVHARRRSVKFGESSSISNENEHPLKHDVTPEISARKHKIMSSAEQKESETTGGSKFDNSPHPSMNKISHRHLPKESNISNVENISNDIVKNNKLLQAERLQTASKILETDKVDEKASPKAQVEAHFEMDNHRGGGDIGGNNTMNDLTEISALFKDGIFWSDDAESLLPARIPETAAVEWRADLMLRRIVRLLPGCGRDKNRLAILDNGEKLCCRYRQNFDQIKGDIISFYFSQLLGIDNLPFAALMEVERNSEQWEVVKENLTKAGWKDGKIIVVSRWISDLEPAYMPVEYRSKNRTFHPGMLEDLTSDLNHSLDYLIELMQWSDLILFDYLTANLDRIVNTWVNLQWNKFMFEQPVHNLEVSRSDRKLVFLDNESGLLHGYRMLPQYGHYHDQILKSVCVFREQTKQRLLELNNRLNRGNIWDALKATIDLHEPLFEILPSYPPKFRDVLQERIAAVVEHINQCQTKN